jgi:hypothetical protein
MALKEIRHSVRLLAALTVVVAASVLSGCGGNDGGGDGRVLHSGSSNVLIGAKGDGDNVAGVGFAGTVSLAGGCLGIGGATIIWPYGTQVSSDDPLTIYVPGLGRLTVGDRVDGGGDEYGDHLPKGIDAVPSDCPTEQVVAFFPNR